MKYKKWYFIFILFSNVSVVYGGTCSFGADNTIVASEPIVISAGDPVNTILKFITGSNALVYYNCSGWEGEEASGTLINMGLKSSLSGTGDVFNSSLPGIAYHIGAVYSWDSGSIDRWMVKRPLYPMVMGLNPSGSGAIWGAPQVQIIKTSEKFTPGILNEKIASYYMGSVAQGWAHEVDIYFNATIQLATCMVSSANVNVPLGTWDTSTFSGINSTTTLRPINLSLNCPSTGAKVTATISAMSAAPTNGVINLSSSPGITSASGVSVQVIDSAGNPVILNQPILITNAAKNVFNLGWQARYIQTKSVITGGQANAVATATFTYN